MPLARWLILLPLALWLSVIAEAPAQEPAAPPPAAAPSQAAAVSPDANLNFAPPSADANYEPGIQGLNPTGPLPGNAFQDPTGLPYSSVPFLERTGGDLNNITQASSSQAPPVTSMPKTPRGSFTFRQEISMRVSLF
jgi:hypothetical protein